MFDGGMKYNIPVAVLIHQPLSGVTTPKHLFVERGTRTTTIELILARIYVERIERRVSPERQYPTTRTARIFGCEK